MEQQIIWSSWSNGIKYEKSLKEDRPSIIENINNVASENVITAALASIPEPPPFLYNDISNKREEANNKMSERYLVGQGQQNPFLANNNYLQDLDIQQNFLIPKNSNNKDFIYSKN
jgi:hypothetical protein